jgi:hypothetical protein
MKLLSCGRRVIMSVIAFPFLFVFVITETGSLAGVSTPGLHRFGTRVGVACDRVPEYLTRI